jgi:hypothetical protein
MRNATGWWRWLLVAAVAFGFAGSAQAQRTVTLRLNTATLPDTLSPASVIKVMGAVGGTAPFTLPDGKVISWDTGGANQSTLNVQNVGGDYWEISFQVPNDQATTYKFFSAQAERDGVNGWEADPNPEIAAGTDNVVLPVHYFESQSEWWGVSGDRGGYDWRPFESKADSVAVLFRVAMFGDESRSDSYDPAMNPPDQRIGVRGDPGVGNIVDWGVTNVYLTRESSNSAQPGYNMYSGVAYYPASAAGQVQNYKFVLEHGTTVGWEEGNVSGNRTFAVPQSDTTLHWVYYGNTAPTSVLPVESLAIFTVDLSPLEDIGIFNRTRGDTLWVYGSFNGWQNCPTTNPDLCLMQAVPGESQFELAAPLTEVPGKAVTYKYFLDFNNQTFQGTFGMAPPSGWEEGHRTGNDRTFFYANSATQDLGVSYYNDITPANVIASNYNVDVTFSVDMTPAFANQAQPFNPAGGDSVTIRIADPIWAFTQGVVGDPRGDGDFPLFINKLVLTDPDGDNVYTGTLRVNGPTYSALTYRYAYGQGSSFIEETGSDTKTPGRNRVFYIKPNADGTWPSTAVQQPATFHLEAGPLPFETNPAFGTGVDDVGGEIPAQVKLGQNYPNPFNPTTAFEYSLPATQHVTVRVFDVLGRAVATLVDGVQGASTYRVTFDASQLASGVYVYRLETPTQVLTRTMLLVK